jgi:hypothetical protein
VERKLREGQERPAGRTVALHGKQESDLDTEPVLLVRSLQHPEMLNTRYLRLLQGAADGRLRLAGYTVGVRFASTLGGRFFPAPTLGRCMGVTTSIGLRHNHQR